MRRYFILSAFGLLLEGCVSTLPVRVDEPFNNDNVLNIPQVNARLGQSEAVVNCTDGNSYHAFNVTIDSDSVRFADLDSGVPRYLPARSVISIEQQDHFRGAIAGFGLGTLTGVTAGLAIVAFSPESSHTDGLGSGWTIIAATGLGMIFGPIIGGATGSTDRYQFQAPQDSSKKSLHIQAGAH